MARLVGTAPGTTTVYFDPYQDRTALRGGVNFAGPQLGGAVTTVVGAGIGILLAVGINALAGAGAACLTKRAKPKTGLYVGAAFGLVSAAASLAIRYKGGA